MDLLSSATQPIIIATLGPGEMFGEVALVAADKDSKHHDGTHSITHI
jgi:CRP-like cAMP-binding protein